MSESVYYNKKYYHLDDLVKRVKRYKTEVITSTLGDYEWTGETSKWIDLLGELVEKSGCFHWNGVTYDLEKEVGGCLRPVYKEVDGCEDCWEIERWILV